MKKRKREKERKRQRYIIKIFHRYKEISNTAMSNNNMLTLYAQHHVYF